MSGKRLIGRRTVLGGAAGLAAAGLAPAPAVSAGESAGESTVESVGATRLDRDLIALRRDLHRHPETAGAERRTAAVVAHRLRAAGLEVTTGVGGHGVVGVLRGARPGGTVAYRADMDAVPPNAQFGGGTAPAHLCGHDIHTTVGVGVAEALARRRHRLGGTVMFLFQPAEEALTGAAAMLADGVFDEIRPTEIHALHCGPFPVGHFAVMPGFGMPGQDRGTVTLTGPDAVARAQALAAGINALGTVTPSPVPEVIERMLTDLQTPNGPLAAFVFMGARPVDAEVQISYRCWPEPRYTEVRAAVVALARSHGPATVTFPADPFPAMVVPEREGRAMARYLRRTTGADRVATLHAAVPFNGEDYALFLGRIPGTYTFLGVRKPGFPINSAYPHMPAFSPDERAIGVGVRVMSDWLTTRT
jgi:metal-dependent amidase/aminoacylase/carboxypeptidase family protein